MENTTPTVNDDEELFDLQLFFDESVLAPFTKVSSAASKKAESCGGNTFPTCGGNTCPTCGKCRDWYRSGNYWDKRVDATCSGTIHTDTDGRPDGGGSTRTYVSGHGPATDWDTTGATCTHDHHGGRYGHGVFTLTRGTADTSSGHDRLCACKFD